MNRLWFSKEAENWNEALPIGNGFLGAMVFGKTSVERIQVNEDSLWSGGFMERTNPDARQYLDEVRKRLYQGKVEEAEHLASQSMYATYPHMRHYQTMGDIWLDFFCDHGKRTAVKDENGLLSVQYDTVPVKDYSRELNLEQAIGTVSYSRENVKYEREYFASNPAMIMTYRMKSEKEKKINFELSLTRKDNRQGRGASFCDGVEVLEDKTVRMYGSQGGADGIRFELAVQAEINEGKQYRMGSHLIVEGASEVVLYITARTSYRSKDPHAWCMDTLSSARKLGYEKLRHQHMEDYRKYFLASQLILEEDPSLERLTTPERLQRMREQNQDVGLINTYYNYGRYLLISSSREHSLPANLQGIWNEEFEPMWGSKYTININIQMNYWMAEKTGLSQLHMPLLEHLKKMDVHGKDVADKMYGARGFCCHHNTDIWGDCAPQDNHVSATIWPMGGAWLCLHIIEHYRYGNDSEFMEEYFPILQDAVLFFLDYMIQDENGYWITGPSSSPENIYVNEGGECGCLCMGPTMDTEILRELFTGYLRIAEEMHKEDEISTEVQKRLDGLTPLQIGRHGQIQEWRQNYEELEIGHRHISQLFALYPAAQIRPDTTPELAKAAEKTLQRRLENGGGHTGWSKAWIILFYARLKKAEDAWENLEELLKKSTLPNLFDNHPPFQIDGNFGGACALLEMIVQDFEEELLLLPALPSKIPNGSLTGVRTKSGCILDITWKDGHMEKAVLTGIREGKVTLLDERGVSHPIEFQKGQKVEEDFQNEI